MGILTKKCFFISLMALLPLMACAQLDKKKAKEVEKMEATGLYLIGRGVSATVTQASEMALSNLSSQISTNVRSDLRTSILLLSQLSRLIQALLLRG